MSWNNFRPPRLICRPLRGQDGAPDGHVGVGQVEHDGVVVAHRTLGVVESRPGVVDTLGVHVIRAGGRLLGIALELAGHDLGQARRP